MLDRLSPSSAAVTPVAPSGSAVAVPSINRPGPSCFVPDRSGHEPYDQICNDSDVLQHMLEVESSRQRLERYARELSRLAESSANATRDAQQEAKHKGDLLATLSHEIRTPLNGILGMANLLGACSLGPVEREYVDVIRQAGDSLLALIDDVLDFSKIEADRLELECADLNVQRLLDDALRIVQPVSARKGLKLMTVLSPDVPALVNGDALRLRQVLLNFLSNAIKFTAAGEVCVRVDPIGLPSGVGLRFTVIDQGIGISPEGQARLFQPFSQADPSIARQYGGTGLGLAICKRLAEKMGGSIGVSSQVGVGSAFWFTAQMAPASGILAPTSENGPALPEHQIAPRILLVEDNLINQKVAVLLLKKFGFTPTVVGNGAEALRAISEAPFDLVFMDCLMPEMDGFTATRAIRNRGGQFCHLPIVAMTANAFSKDREACLEAGMSDFLTKPVRQGDLQAMLEKWLPAVRIRPAVPVTNSAP